MKISVKTLKGSSFEIDVTPQDKVVDVKKNIEATQGQSLYPADQLMLIYQGKILKDETTLEDNKVAENSFVVVMLSKAKPSASGASSASKVAVNLAPPSNTVPPAVPVPQPASSVQTPVTTLAPVPSSALTPMAPTPAPAVSMSTEADVYGLAASNLVSGSNLEETIQQILNMGGGSWDRDTVVRALRAAYNNPERAVDYLYSGIPENVEVPPVSRAAAGVQQANPQIQAAEESIQLARGTPAMGPNANPLDLFPQEMPGAGTNAGGAGGLSYLLRSPQFRTLLALVRSNPQVLQPMLQELGKQNPQILRLIQENQTDFLRMINESSEGGEGNVLGQLAGAVPHAISVTPEEQEAIQRLQDMGFSRERVIEVFFACEKNEELAANYLLDHINDFDEE